MQRLGADLVARSALALGGRGRHDPRHRPARWSPTLEQALAAIGDEHPGLRVRLLARLAIELAYEPDSERRDAVSQRGTRTLPARIDDPAALAAALNARHVDRLGPGRMRASAWGSRARCSPSPTGPATASWRCRRATGVIVDLLELGDGPPSARSSMPTPSSARGSACRPLPGTCRCGEPRSRLLEGRIAEGLELSRRARDLGRQAGDANSDVFFSEQYLCGWSFKVGYARSSPPAQAVDADVPERAQSGPAWRAYRFTFAWWHAARGELELARRRLRGRGGRWPVDPAPRRQLAGRPDISVRGLRPARRRPTRRRAAGVARAIQNADGRSRPGRLPRGVRRISAGKARCTVRRRHCRRRAVRGGRAPRRSRRSGGVRRARPTPPWGVPESDRSTRRRGRSDSQGRGEGAIAGIQYGADGD